MPDIASGSLITNRRRTKTRYHTSVGAQPVDPVAADRPKIRALTGGRQWRVGGDQLKCSSSTTNQAASWKAGRCRMT